MDLSFKGRAKRIDDIDLPKLGQRLGVGEDELHAFIDAETRGTGFDSIGRPRILFERHIFHKYVPRAKRTQAMNAGLANATPGGYGKESEQYGKLLAAIAIDKTSALYSCSWGLAQVMGFNHEAAGYATVEDMIAAFMDDEEEHLEAAVNFILKNKLDDELRRHDWAGFARGYNGKNYRINRYDEKLADAYAKWRRIKDTPWSPGEWIGEVWGEPKKPEPWLPVGTTPITQPAPPEPTPEPGAPPAAPQPAPKGKSGLIAILSIIIAGIAAYLGID